MFDINMYLSGLARLFSPISYGQTLEKYIESRFPKDISDIERYTYEWHRIHSGRWL